MVKSQKLATIRGMNRNWNLRQVEFEARKFEAQRRRSIGEGERIRGGSVFFELWGEIGNLRSLGAQHLAKGLESGSVRTRTLMEVWIRRGKADLKRLYDAFSLSVNNSFEFRAGHWLTVSETRFFGC
ncbi:hypothetical protein L484_018406 [Morus notabilis]|uniref:Uncharacterized protein n=1 Tax=Morus notabilis TaxID=981085 RepID=W9QD49_9ROSA|nr:hypothetical protein L484_018406 [Morus notabilis]